MVNAKRGYSKTSKVSQFFFFNLKFSFFYSARYVFLWILPEYVLTVTFSFGVGVSVTKLLVGGNVLARLSGVREAEHVVLAQDHAGARLQDCRFVDLGTTPTGIRDCWTINTWKVGKNGSSLVISWHLIYSNASERSITCRYVFAGRVVTSRGRSLLPNQILEHVIVLTKGLRVSHPSLTVATQHRTGTLNRSSVRLCW